MIAVAIVKVGRYRLVARVDKSFNAARKRFAERVKIEGNLVSSWSSGGVSSSGAGR